MEQQRSRPARPPPPSASQQMNLKLQKVSDCYDSSMCHVKNALSADESGNLSSAIEHYVHALCCLEMGIEVELPRSREQACLAGWQKQAKMMDALENVRTRLYELQKEDTPKEFNPSAPTYEEMPPQDSIQAGTSTEQVAIAGTNAQSAVELLSIPHGVQIYSVSGSDVSASPPSYPTSLTIMLFDDNSKGEASEAATRPPAFIRVGDWVYPLVPGRSPVLRCINGAYVFPNLSISATWQPDTVGLVLSSQLDATYRETFENILENFALLQIQDHALPDEPMIDLSASVPLDRTEPIEGEETVAGETSLGEKVAYGIGKGAGWLSWGLSKGAEITTSLIKQGATHIQKNVTPNEKPTEVHPTLQKGLHYTNEAAKVTVKVSGAVVKGVTAVAGQLARQVAPHVKSYADSMLPQAATEKNEKGTSAMDDVITVAGAGLAGFGTVWTSLENAGLAIAKSASSATVDTVEFKYGSSAGVATSNAVGAAVNLGRTAFNIDNIGVKALAKRTAKETGKVFLKGYVEEKKSQPGSSSSAAADTEGGKETSPEKIAKFPAGADSQTSISKRKS